MAWYNEAIFKYAQIWNVNYNNKELGPCLHALYEITYKYQMMQSQRFKGHPKRQQNIQAGLEKTARKIIGDCVAILGFVFEDWMSKHAILNPMAWGKQRVEEHAEIGSINPKEVADLLNGAINTPDKRGISDDEIIANISEAMSEGKCPIMQRWFEAAKQELIDYTEEDPDNTIPIEQLQQQYQEMTFEDYYHNYAGGEDLATFFEGASQFYSLEEMAVEFMAYGAFPEWYGVWGPKGIADTRQGVENVYRQLQGIQQQPIDQALASLNIVINTAHQTGWMTDYIAQYTGESSRDLIREMTRLSNLDLKSPDIKAWHGDLSGVGVQLPKAFQPPKLMPPAPPMPQHLKDHMDQHNIERPHTV